MSTEVTGMSKPLNIALGDADLRLSMSRNPYLFNLLHDLAVEFRVRGIFAAKPSAATRTYEQALCLLLVSGHPIHVVTRGKPALVAQGIPYRAIRDLDALEEDGFFRRERKAGLKGYILHPNEKLSELVDLVRGVAA